MKHRLFRTRRLGVALIAGVTALGAAATIGQGVASAAPTTVAAALATGTVAKPILGTSAGPAATEIDVTLTSGTVAPTDQIVLSLPCSPALQFASATVTSPTGSAAGDFTSASTGSSVGCGFKDELVMPSSAATTVTNTTPTVVTITPTYTASGAAPGAVSLTGSYQALGSAISFSVPSDATVVWFSVTSNTPPVSLNNAPVAQAVSNVSISQPAGFETAGGTSLSGTAVTVTLTGATFSGTPVVTQTGSSAPTGVTAAGATLTFTAGTFAANAFSLVTISGISVIPSGPGTITASIDYTGAPIHLSSPVIATVLGSSNRIYGATPDATVAQEFENAFPVVNGGASTVVLATDAQPYDALSAAYLEGQLGTGLLITPPTSLGADAMAALKLEGVKTVYVVGGPLAVAPSVITQLEATPAWNAGGLTESGANLKVVGPIYGQTAADTAQKIATYFGAGAYSSLDLSGAYSAATSTSGGGLYNDTPGSASATGPAAAVPTVIVISETDWQDAMTMAPLAYASRIPIVLTSGTALSSQASAALTTLGAKQVIVVGGQLAVTNAVVSAIQALNGGISVLRIAGQIASDTAGQIANFALAASTAGLAWGQATSPAGVATSAFLVSHANYWSDALGAAAIGGTNFAVSGTHYGYEPILLIDTPTSTGKYIGPVLNTAGSVAGIQGDTSIRTLNILGGPLAVPPTIVSTLQADLAAG